jgi:hypothetical protein
MSAKIMRWEAVHPWDFLPEISKVAVYLPVDAMRAMTCEAMLVFRIR